MIRRFANRGVFRFWLVLVLVTFAALSSLAQSPTTTMLVSSANPSTFGQQVTFSATVVDVGGIGIPTGIVTFADAGKLIGAAQLDASGVATFSTALLTPGSHAMVSTYVGDSNFSGSSDSQTQQVNPRPTALTVTVSATPVGVRVDSPISIAVSDTATTGPAGLPGSFAASPYAMNTPRSGHTATLLLDGTVLVAGGASDSGVSGHAERYAPLSGFATLPNALQTARTGHSATLLPGGTVLLAGGSTSGAAADALNSLEIFDPAAGAFTPSSAQLATRRTAHTATLLPSGKILIAGGYDPSGNALNTTELYDPALNNVAAGPGPLGAYRAGHTATLLRNGTILFAGGATSSSEIYDPATGSTVITGNLNVPRIGHAVTLLPDGNVLVTGGVTMTDPVSTVELYDTVAGTFVLVGSMNAVRSGHTATLLDSALVLIAGGWNAMDGTLNNAELYTPSFDPQGAVALLSDHPFDTFGSPCVLGLSGTAVASCQTSVKPVQVGTGTHRVTGTYAGGNNHSGSTNHGDLGVVVATPTIVVDDLHFFYDGNPHPAQARALAADGYEVFGTFSFTYDGSHAAPRHVGAYAVVATFTSADPNFSNNIGSGTLTIGSIEVTAQVTVSNKVYDGTSDATITGRTLIGVQGSDDVSLTGGTAVFADASRGDNKVVIVTGLTLSGAASGNYYLTSTSVSTTANITARQITLTAGTKTKFYGDADPPLTYTITEGSLAGSDQITGAPSRVPGETVLGGPYAIQAGTLAVNSNYSFNFLGANLTVAPRPVTVTADPKTVIYGEPEPALTYQITSGSLVSGDAFSGALAREAGQSAGTYAIGQGTLALNANYALTYQGANLVIGVRSITVSADPKTKIYGDADPGFTYQIANGSLVGGEGITGALTRSAGENVGDYTITQGTLALSANYSLTYQPASLTVAPRSLTVAAQAQGKIYGTLDPTLGYSIAAGSLQFNDSFTGALTRDAGDNAGAYPIRQGTLALSPNYNLSYVGAMFTVAPATTHSSMAVRFTATDLKLTLTATVHPQFTGAPAGSVTFMDAVPGFPGGTVPLVNGIAQLEIGLGQLAAGTHNLFAQYDRSDPNFASVSTAVPAMLLVAPAIGVTSGQTIPEVTLAISNPRDQTITLTNLGCQVEPMVGTVPNDARPACALRSSPATLPPGTTSITLTLDTKAGSSAQPAPRNAGLRVGGLYATLVGLPAVAFLGLALPGASARSKRGGRRWLVWLGLFSLVVVLLAIAGCGGGGFDNPDNLQPSTGGGTQPGSYVVVVRYNDAQANLVPLATVPLNVSY